jgi:hypothetical protein
MNQRVCHLRKSLIALYLILIIFGVFVGYGILLYLNHYVISKPETVSGFDTWIEGDTQEAYFYFTFTSDAFITTNYPVNVHVKIVVYNSELIPIINSKSHQVLSIVFSEYYPPTYSELNGLPNTGAIELKYDGDRTYEGENKILFPYLGDDYAYIFSTRNAQGNIVTEDQIIYSENKTSPTSSAKPPINIEEGYSARASYEQANQSNGISFAAFGVAGIALVAYYQFEVVKDKTNNSSELEKQIKQLNDAIEKLRKEIKRKDS